MTAARRRAGIAYPLAILLWLAGALTPVPSRAETPLEAWERIERVKQAQGSAAALPGARQALIDHPTFLPLLTQHARMRASCGGFTADEALRDSLRTSGSVDQARLASAFFDLERGSAPAALDTLALLPPAPPRSVEQAFQLLDRAAASTGTGRYSLADSLLRDLRTHPASSDGTRYVSRYLRVLATQAEASLLQRQGQSEAALERVASAIAQARAGGFRDLTMRLHNLEGRFHAAEGGLEAAIADYRAALSLASDLRDEWQWAGTASWLAYALEQRGRYAEAFELRLACLDLLPRMGDSGGIPYNLLGLGWAALKIGRMELAEDVLRRALEHGEKQGWVWLQGQSLLNLGVLYMDTGRLDTAMALLEQGLAVAEASPQLVQRTGFLNNMAIVHLEQHRPDHAIEIYEQLLEIHRADHDVPGQSRILNNMALASEMMGQYQQARVMYEECLRLSERQEFDDNVSRINLGRRLTADGRWDEGERYLRQAIDVARSRGAARDLSDATAELGRCLSYQGKMPQALHHLEVADSLREATGIAGPRVPDLIRLSLVQFAMGRWDDVLETLNRAETLAHRISPTHVPTTHALRAFTHLERGAVELARAEARAAEESAWSGLADDRSSERFVRQIVSSGAITALLHSIDRDDEDDVEAITRETFGMLQQAKSRTLLEYVQGGQRSIEPDVPDSVVAKERAARAAIDRIRRTIDQTPAFSSEADSLRLALAEAQSIHERLRTQIFQSDRRYRDVSTPASFDSTSLRDLLGPRTLVLDYFTSRNCEGWFPCETTLFVADTQGIEAHSVGDTRNLTRQTNLLLDLLSHPPSSDDEAIQLLLRELGESLLGPVADRLGRYDDVVIVPDGILQRIPFMALVIPDPRNADRTTYVAELAAVQIVPSLPVLQQLRAGSAGSASQETRWDIAIWPGPAAAESDRTGSHELDLDLPHASEELRTLVARFPSAAVLDLKLRDEPALHTQLSGLEPIGASKILHFIAHGYFDDLQPWRSGLYLGPAGVDGEPAKLEIADVYHMDLRSSLITLSACETARGAADEGVGFLGFTQALFGSGATSVLATLWPIDDASAPHFMASFYEMLGRGHGKSEALRRAQLGFLEDENLRHPFYWAAYVLMGDGSEGIDLNLRGPSPLGRPWAMLALGGLLLIAALWTRRREARD